MLKFYPLDVLEDVHRDRKRKYKSITFYHFLAAKVGHPQFCAKSFWNFQKLPIKETQPFYHLKAILRHLTGLGVMKYAYCAILRKHLANIPHLSQSVIGFYLLRSIPILFSFRLPVQSQIISCV